MNPNARGCHTVKKHRWYLALAVSDRPSIKDGMKTHNIRGGGMTRQKHQVMEHIVGVPNIICKYGLIEEIKQRLVTY